MKRLALTAVSVALALGLAAAPTVPGATTSGGGAAQQVRITISEKGKAPPFTGTFALVGKAGADSGRTAVTVGPGRAGIRNGQSFHRVSGTDHFYGKKGEFLIRFTGVAVDVAEATDVEYGTWSVYTQFGTGVYEGWRGGGRWASSSTEGRYVVRWEGLITR